MPELMNENIRRPFAIGCHGRVQIEDSAATIGLAIHQNFNELVRRVRSEIAQGAVLGSKNVALGIEGVVGGAERGAVMNAARRTRNARFFRRRAQSPDVEIGTVLAKGRAGKKYL